MSHRKRAILLVGCSAVVLFSCAIGATQLFFKHCLLWTCAPERAFKAVDLGIPMDLFPDGSIGGKMGRTHESEGAVDKAAAAIFWDQGQGRAAYSVWRFGTTLEAHTFQGVLQRIDRDSGFQVCLEDLRVRAEEYSITCGWSQFGGYTASLDARYEEFVISLSVLIGDRMSLDDFRRVVVFVDDQMTARLHPK